MWDVLSAISQVPDISQHESQSFRDISPWDFINQQFTCCLTWIVTYKEFSKVSGYRLQIKAKYLIFWQIMLDSSSNICCENYSLPTLLSWFHISCKQYSRVFSWCFIKICPPAILVLLVLYILAFGINTCQDRRLDNSNFLLLSSL